MDLCLLIYTKNRKIGLIAMYLLACPALRIQENALELRTVYGVGVD
jgi:hypothetical protein